MKSEEDDPREGEGRTVRAAREILLTVGAVLGTVCLMTTLAGLFLGVKPYVVQSDSMSPTMHAGDLVLTRTVSAPGLDVGDVVTVLSENSRRVTHRITTLAHTDDGTVLTLKGDANSRRRPGDLPRHEGGSGLDRPSRSRLPRRLDAQSARPPRHRSAGRLRSRRCGQTARTRDRALTGVVAAASLGLGALHPVAGDTTAYFTDNPRLASSALSRVTLTPPSPATCSSALLSATVSWPADARYDYEVVLRRVSNGAVVSTRQVTGSGSSVTYSGLLDFGLVVGAGTVDFNVEIRSKLASAPTWTSSTVTTYSSVRVLAILVGATVGCTT